MSEAHNPDYAHALEHSFPDRTIEIKRQLISNRIKLALKGQSITALASKLKVAPSTIYDWRSARFLPDIEHLALFAALTGFDIRWLITGNPPERIGAGPDDRYLIPGSLNLQRTPLAFLGESLFEIARSADAKVEELNMMVVADDAMTPTLRRGELALAWYLPRKGVGRAYHFVSAPLDGIYALQVKARVGDRDNPPLTRTIARRLRWGLTDEAVTISCDNESYAGETRTLKIKEAPLIVGPIIWRAGRI